MTKIEELTKKYRELLLKQAELEEDLEFDDSTELNDEITKVYEEIVKHPEGADIIAGYMDDENPWVRLWSAAASKNLYPDKAKAVFTELATRDELISLKASLNLHTLSQD